MGSFTLDMKEFDRRFDELNKTTIPGAGRRGAFKAASQLLLDADNIEPKTPLKEGMLKGSKTIEIEAQEDGGAEIRAGYNIEYASYVHEMIPLESFGEKQITWTEPGSGPKYLESKLTLYADKYLEIMAASIREEGGG
jgi:hypothetical protein